MTTRDVARTTTRLLTGAAMVFAGVGHLTFVRREFRAQVPEWVPGDPDTTVLASGVAEIALGAGMIAAPTRFRPTVGALLAAFFVAVFPGNIAQWRGHRDAFGLDSDRKRVVRLFFQPLLIAAALWSTRTPTK